MHSFTSPTDVKEAVSKAVRKYVDADSSFVFLFGSRALGEEARASDYDIGIYTGKKIPLGVIGQIKGDLEEYPFAFDFDVVDFSTTSPEFRKIALQKIELWNTPKTNLKLI